MAIAVTLNGVQRPLTSRAWIAVTLAVDVLPGGIMSSRASITVALFLVASASLANLGAATEINGHWVFSSQIAIGHDLARVALEETGDGIQGRYFGILGQNMPITGSKTGDRVALVTFGRVASGWNPP